MKKIISIIFAVALVFAVSSTAFAAGNTTLDSKIAGAKANNAVLVTNDSVYDFRQLASKTFTPSRLDNQGMTEAAAVADLQFYANCDLKVDIGRAWSDATSRIDRIMARDRLYDHEALYSSATDDERGSTHAGAGSASPGGWYTKLYGSHAFEQAGYQSWYPETYDANSN